MKDNLKTLGYGYQADTSAAGRSADLRTCCILSTSKNKTVIIGAT